MEEAQKADTVLLTFFGYYGWNPKHSDLDKIDSLIRPVGILFLFGRSYLQVQEQADYTLEGPRVSSRGQCNDPENHHLRVPLVLSFVM